MPVGAPRRPGPDPVDDRIVGLGRRQRGGRYDGQVDRRGPTPDPGHGQGARAGVEPDLDDIDPPVEDLGERHRPRSERPPGVVGGERDLDEQVGQRTTRRATHGRRPEHDLTGPRPCVPEGTEVLGHAAGEDDRHLGSALGDRGDQGGQLAQRATLVGDGGSPAPTRIPCTSASRSIADIASGSVVSALPETVRQPLREAVATSGASARSEAATTASRRGA